MTIIITKVRVCYFLARQTQENSMSNLNGSEIYKIPKITYIS